MLVELHTLGHCLVTIGDERLGPQSPFAFALALYLGVERGRPHTREQLLPLFFPGTPEANAAHSLRQTLYKLRQLGFPAETTPAGMIVAASDVRDDYSQLLATGELADPRAARLPGEFLPGYWPRLSDDYTRWLEGQRDAVNSALRRAYVSRILDRRAVARWDEVERFARACLAIDPLNEEATLALAEALALSGSKAAGVKVLDAYLAEVGLLSGSLTLPASVLRKRISERSRNDKSPADLPFIGREVEMSVLNDALSDAVCGQQAVVWFHGEPGIGKTRLVHEFTAKAMLGGTRVLELNCRPQDQHQALSLFYALVPQLLTLPGALGCSPRSLELLRGFTPRTQQAGAPRQVGLAAGQALNELSDALQELVEAIGSECPLVIAIDDAHWLDSLSKQVVTDYSLSAAHSRSLFAICSREQPPIAATQHHAFRSVRLRGMSVHSSAHLLELAFARIGMAVQAPVIERATALGAGNPFYLRLLAEHFSRDPEANHLPMRLKEILEQRVTSVSRQAEAVLMTCTVLGRHSTVMRLEQILEMPRFQLVQSLTELELVNLVRLEGSQVSVSHDLIADSVLRSTPTTSANVIRRAAAQLLEDEARASGDIGFYWAAYDCWRAYGDRAAATRCAAEAATLDAIVAAVRVVDTSSPSTLDVSYDRPPSQQQRCAAEAMLTVADPSTLGLCASHSDTHEDPSPSVRPRSHATPIPPTAESLIRLAENPSGSGAVRLRAAVGALAIAEYNLDSALAEHALRCALEVGSSATGHAKADLERALLAYHSVFGDQSVALRLATQLESGAERYDSTDVALRSRLNAAEAFSRCGFCARSLAFFEQLYVEAMETGLHQRAGNASIRALWIARQVQDAEAVNLWRARSVNLGRNPESPSYTTYLYNEALLATDRRDWSALGGLLDRMHASVPPDLSPYHRALITAASLRLKAAVAPDTMDEGAVRDLAGWSLNTTPIVPQDDVALSCTYALNAINLAAGRDFLGQYLARRRIRTHPVLHELTVAGR